MNTSKAESKAASAAPAPAAAATSTTEGGAENSNQAANPPAGEKEPAKASQDPAQKESKEKDTKEKAGENTEKQLRKKLQTYFDAYPTADKFYVTTDGQPFFEAQWAREHQKSVDPENKLTIVNR